MYVSNIWLNFPLISLLFSAYFRRVELHQGLLGHQPQPPQGRHRVPADIPVLLGYECAYVTVYILFACVYVVYIYVYDMGALTLHACVYITINLIHIPYIVYYTQLYITFHKIHNYTLYITHYYTIYYTLYRYCE